MWIVLVFFFNAFWCVGMTISYPKNLDFVFIFFILVNFQFKRKSPTPRFFPRSYNIWLGTGLGWSQEPEPQTSISHLGSLDPTVYSLAEGRHQELKPGVRPRYCNVRHKHTSLHLHHHTKHCPTAFFSIFGTLERDAWVAGTVVQQVKPLLVMLLSLTRVPP